jgi:L-threonylcarbamoyladenylate synthase
MSVVLPWARPADRRDAEGRVRRHLEADGVIAYPTETVYGLGCTLRPAALERLAAFKGERPFLLLIRDRREAAGLAWSPAAERLADAFWPGPLTLALDDPDHAYPPQVRGPDGAVAVRVSPHPGIDDLLAAAGGPVTSTSANRPGEPPALDAAAAADAGRAIQALLVLDGGPLPPSMPSTVVRCGARVRILREGALARRDLETVTELE